MMAAENHALKRMRGNNEEEWGENSESKCRGIRLALYSMCETVVMGRMANEWRNRGHGMEVFDRLRIQPMLFRRMYRLSVADFDKVSEAIHCHLVVHCETMALRSSGSVVHPSTQLCMTLRYLAGGSYLDIVLLYGVDKSTFYKYVQDLYAHRIQIYTISFVWWTDASGEWLQQSTNPIQSYFRLKMKTSWKEFRKVFSGIREVA